MCSIIKNTEIRNKCTETRLEIMAMKMNTLRFKLKPCPRDMHTSSFPFIPPQIKICVKKGNSYKYLYKER